MKNKLTFETIRERGLLLFEYIRGSQLYGLNTPTSDEDHGGIFICPQDQVLGLGLDYQEEVSDNKHDTTWWEVGKFLRLALSSNPTVLEALFVPDDKVLFEDPYFGEIRRKFRNHFLTKACFKPFGGYAVAQIKKAQGQNKKIHWDMEDMQRKTPLDFCYTFDGDQGSKPLLEWLDERGLRQDCCGVTDLPNMPTVHALYYDYGQHFQLCGINCADDLYDINNTYIAFRVHIFDTYITDTLDVFYNEHKKPLGGHCGIIDPAGKANTIRHCSTQKGEKPLCMFSYNQNGYETHCRKYKEYEEWKNKRNKARYESNLEAELSDNPDMKYDVKNMMHSFRLVNMCIEIAEGKGINLDRTNIDRELLMDVRNRKYGYSELMEMLEKQKAKMDSACECSTIPEAIDSDFVDNLLLEIRQHFSGKM